MFHNMPTFNKRQRVTISPETLVKSTYLKADQLLPLVLEPSIADVNVVEWASLNKAFIEAQLLKHGGILFRNFTLNPQEDLYKLMEILAHKTLTYQDRATPRTEISEGIYTSTDYPSTQIIELHNENSYAYSWPSKIAFCCVTPATTGGETPIADCQRLYQRIPPEMRERFEGKGLMYIRNFGERFGMSWQAAFQTSEKAEMEKFCQQAHIEVQWKDDQRLRTQQIQPAVIVHPASGEKIWFNQAMAFHSSTLESEVRATLLREFAEIDLPKNVFYGDGSPIDAADLEVIRRAYRQETISFLWQQGDILLLDNIRVAHGRSPFTGKRCVIVSMADAYNWDQVAHSMARL